MKKTFLFLFFTLPELICAQSVQMARQYSYPLTDVVFNNDSAHPKLSAMSYFSCCTIDSAVYTSPLPFSFSTWAVNHSTGNSSDTYLKVDLVGASGNPVVYSDTVTLAPGDSVQIHTASVSKPGMELDYALLQLYENNTLTDLDTLPLVLKGIDEATLSQCFGLPDNYFGTDELGDDESGIALLFPLDKHVEIKGVTITLGPNTIPGGDFLIQVFDSNAFNPQTGFNGSPVLQQSFSITGLNAPLGRAEMRTFLFNNSIVHETFGYVWLRVLAFSNSGTTPIEIGNSKRIEPGQDAAWFYNRNSSQWKRNTDTTAEINNPVITVETFILHKDLIGIKESEWNSFSFYPNPAKESVWIKMPGNWQEAQYSIYTSNGIKVMQGNIKPDESIRINRMQAGCYWICLEYKDTKHIEKLFVE